MNITLTGAARNKEIVNKYTINGIPSSSIDKLLDETGRTRKEFDEYFFGQTCGIIGNELLYYTHDIERFINNLKPLD